MGISAQDLEVIHKGVCFFMKFLMNMIVPNF